MKPYIDGKYLIPCKVNKIINNEDKYGTSLESIYKYKDKIKNIGDACSDCASIFENDSLGSISELSNGGSIEMELL